MTSKRSLCLGVAAVVACSATHVGATPAPTCGGRVATITGSAHGEAIDGTNGDDVIVARGGSDVVDGKGGRDIICGGRGTDYLSGGRGDDRLFGQGGDDTFSAGEDRGDDDLDGGPGSDLLFLPTRRKGPGYPGPAQVDLAAGTAIVSRAGTDSIALGTVENVYGTGHGDEIRGDNGDNVLDSGASGGRGFLDGRDGDDTLRAGQDGAAEMLGGPGNDELVPLSKDNVMDGGEGTDTVVSCAGLDVTVDLAQGLNVFHHPDGDEVSSLTAIENASTCHGDDTLIGDDGPNVLVSKSGDDHFEGRGGDDTIEGRGGTDTADGGDGTDSCSDIETPTNCEA